MTIVKLWEGEVEDLDDCVVSVRVLVHLDQREVIVEELEEKRWVGTEDDLIMIDALKHALLARL